jgi:hypothetical protein
LNHRKNSEGFPERKSFWAVETTPHGLAATEGGQTASLCNIRGLTTTEVSQIANLCIVHDLIATEASQTASTFNDQNLKLKVGVATVMV